MFYESKTQALLMISELLIGFFIQSNTSTPLKPAVRGESVVIQNSISPSPTFRPVMRSSFKPSATPRTTSTAKPNKTPRATATPAPQIKAVQTSTNLTAQSVLNALNNYRAKNGVGALSIDDKLQSYAQGRADYLKNLGKLDKHAGHKEFMAGNGFSKLGFNAIAENQGWNYKGDAVGLVESFYGKSSGHNKNQINPEYTHVGIGISGAYTNLIFGGKKK